MRFIQYLNEAYVKRVSNPYDFSVEVFENPTRREVIEAGNASYDKHGTNKRVRFMADIQKKKLYVWNSDLLHGYVAQDMGWQYPSHDNNKLYGVASVENRYLKALSVEISFKHANELKDINWLKPWFGDSFKTYLEDRLKREPVAWSKVTVIG